MKLPTSLTAPLALHCAHPLAGARSSTAKNWGGSVLSDLALTWAVYHILVNARELLEGMAWGSHPCDKLDAPYPAKGRAHHRFGLYALDLPSLGLFRR